MKKNLVLIFFTFLVLLVGCGSDFYAEKYAIHANQKELVHKVDSFKKVHPEYRYFGPIDSTLVPKETDGPRAPFQSMGDTSLLRYDFAFHVASENMIFYCNIINYDSLDLSEPTILDFVSVTDTDVRQGYTINTKDLSRKDNSRYKRVFEKEILDNLGVAWENKGRW